jgi:hypothetical protein
MEAHSVELVMGKGWPPRGSLAAAPILPAPKTLNHEVIHTMEFPIGIAGTEIISPTTKYGIEFHDQLLHVFPALLLTGKLSDPRSEFLHRLRAWPSLREVPTRVALDAPLRTRHGPEL